MERSTIGRITGVLIVLLVLIPVTATAQTPTVIVSNYTVTPAVLMPGDEGTITVILSSTAPAAMGSPLEIRLDGGIGGMNTSTENAYIENVLLNGEGVEVLTGSFQ
ncbi:MAG: S-layer protein, partial [Methanoculleus sp.]